MIRLALEASDAAWLVLAILFLGALGLGAWLVERPVKR